MRSSTVLGTAMLVLAAAATVAGTPGSAAADPIQGAQCNPVGPRQVKVCVVKGDAHVFGQIFGVATDVTQIVYQCNGFGSDCGVFIASHGNPTSAKPVSFGHTYRNCPGFTDADGSRWIVCSPFVTG